MSDKINYRNYHFESREAVLVGILAILKSVDLLDPL